MGEPTKRPVLFECGMPRSSVSLRSLATRNQSNVEFVVSRSSLVSIRRRDDRGRQRRPGCRRDAVPAVAPR
jgi:hypothetical protein